MDESRQVGDTGLLTSPDRMPEGVEHQVGRHPSSGSRAHDPSAEHVEDEGDVDGAAGMSCRGSEVRRFRPVRANARTSEPDAPRALAWAGCRRQPLALMGAARRRKEADPCNRIVGYPAPTKLGVGAAVWYPGLPRNCPKA